MTATNQIKFEEWVTGSKTSPVITESSVRLLSDLREINELLERGCSYENN